MLIGLKTYGYGRGDGKCMGARVYRRNSTTINGSYIVYIYRLVIAIFAFNLIFINVLVYSCPYGQLYTNTLIKIKLKANIAMTNR